LAKKISGDGKIDYLCAIKSKHYYYDIQAQIILKNAAMETAMAG
jgi:hypothetical protein